MNIDFSNVDYDWNPGERNLFTSVVQGDLKIEIGGEVHEFRGAELSGFAKDLMSAALVLNFRQDFDSPMKVIIMATEPEPTFRAIRLYRERNAVNLSIGFLQDELFTIVISRQSESLWDFNGSVGDFYLRFMRSIPPELKDMDGFYESFLEMACFYQPWADL